MNLKTWIILPVILFGLSLRLNAQFAEEAGSMMDNSSDNANALLEEKRQNIHNQLEYLKQNNRFTEFLDLTTIIDFPVGIKKTIGNLDYIIAIDSVVLTPTYAYLNASMSFIIPESGERIAFRGTDIRFTSQGGISGIAKLELVGDYIIELPGGRMNLILIGKETYVEWDCEGFKSFGLGGKVNFSRELLIPVNEVGEEMEGVVSGNFSVSINNWNDFIASVSITPFRPANTLGFTFYTSEAIFDFSDLRNPLELVFPAKYESPFLRSDTRNQWRGIFIKSIRVNLPSEFKSEDGEVRYLTAQNFLIDETGISGDIFGQYIIPLDQGSSGSMAGWPFSVEKLEVSFVSNKLNHFLFNGQIILPIASEDSKLEYTAFADYQNNYFFNVEPNDNLKFDLWNAGSVSVDKSSYINVRILNGEFVPEAVLNGEMTIEVERLSAKELSFQSINFENLKLTSDAPFISEGIFSTGSEDELPSFSGFNVDITGIGLKTLPDSSVALDINGQILLSGEKGGAFSAKGGLQLVGEIIHNGTRNKWIYKKSVIKNIELAADNDACQIYGTLQYYSDDPIYGNGYMGLVDAEFKPGIKVTASARFGAVNNMKYWYADALASFSKGIQITPGLGIYGFGGGAYYSMKMKSSNVNMNSMRSGVNYVPDSEAGLGIRAAINLGSMPESKAFNGDAAFEMSFYKTGGIRNINFKGEGYFMTLPLNENIENLKTNIQRISQFTSNKDQPEDLFASESEVRMGSKAEIRGNLNMNYDFSNRVLHGNLEVFIDAAEGMVKGIGNMNRAGWAVMHFAPQEWYIHIGTPSDRLGLKLGFGSISANANGYFMVGTNVPASPPPDENVSRILGNINLDYMRDENSLGKGSGFAMGAALNFDTGDLAYWKFYARFMAGTGFDIMLKNYGSDVNCLNRSGPIGINGWYANGQVYAYLEGNIGIMVDVFGDRRNIDIISLSTAAILQAKLPNPLWMKGVVGGHFNALGGLVQGECRFEATIGEECDMNSGSAVSEIEVIADISPKEGDDEISVFNSPQVIFNLPINEVFELVDFDNRRKSFRIKLDFFRVRNESEKLNGTIEWNSANDVVVFNSDEILPPETIIQVEVQISFEELKGGNWVPVTTNGNKIVEVKSIYFKTGTAPAFIPYENIAYSYPVLEMINFYSEESLQGYIQLKRGQAYLFEHDERWSQKGVMKSAAGTREFDIVYKTNKKRIEFVIPELSNDQICEWRLIKKPVNSSRVIDENVIASVNSIDTDNSDSEINIKLRQAEGTLEQLEDAILFESRFRTSIFDTFTEKMQAIALENTMREMIMEWDLHKLKTSLLSKEHFDLIELEGNKFTEDNPMVKLEADLTYNEYYKDKIEPTIYVNYPLGGVARIEERDVNNLGLVPIKAVEVQYNGNLVRDNFQENINAVSIGNSYLNYELPIIYRQDFYDIRNKVVPMFMNEPNPLPWQINTLIFNSFPIVHEGDYPVIFKYYLPGQTTPNSSFIMNTRLEF